MTKKPTTQSATGVEDSDVAIAGSPTAGLPTVAASESVPAREAESQEQLAKSAEHKQPDQPEDLVAQPGKVAVPKSKLAKPAEHKQPDQPEDPVAQPRKVAVPKSQRSAVQAALKRHWPRLRLDCAGAHKCIQTGDVDGDGKRDVVAIVRRGHQVGAVLFTTALGALLVGAGERVRLTAVDWELDDNNQRVWTREGTQELEQDFRGLGIWVSPASKKTTCARGMQLGHDALVYSGSDAAEVVLVRDGRFCWAPCGY